MSFYILRRNFTGLAAAAAHQQQQQFHPQQCHPQQLTNSSIVLIHIPNNSIVLMQHSACYSNIAVYAQGGTMPALDLHEDLFQSTLSFGKTASLSAVAPTCLFQS